MFNILTIAAGGLANLTGNFFRHYTKQTDDDGNQSIESRRGLIFDQAFSAAQNFFERASHHTVEELQTVGNGFTPSPPWVRVIKVVIPLATRLAAGRQLIETLGDEEVDKVLGGREWWQRTTNAVGGINGEWISMKRDWDGLEDDEEVEGDASREGNDATLEKARLERLKKLDRKNAKHSKKAAKKEHTRLAKSAAAKGEDGNEGESQEEIYSEEMDEMRCMLYIHGGAYFFGSINTHRYSIWRMARKAGQRCFATTYRLSPQFPFPCALADALASYLYLIDPPPEARHRPVDPSKLTIAGDSAGGGLSLALLCLIRDSGLPMPAGAVLISPWCDLTHSFPSILTNTATDVIPAYGFLFQPSTLWPPPAADFADRAIGSRFSSSQSKSSKRKGEKLAKSVEKDGEGDPEKAEAVGTKQGETISSVGPILRVVIDGEEVEVRDQIQLYATNEQLAYPYVSPLWQPSLGGLCPLYILAGDKEVLRDEIIYMAHRAANPAKYPIRKELLEANPARTKLGSTYGPTKVHLQIYDECCHDLTLFSFLTPAKYAYRAIASFQKSVTTPPSVSILSNGAKAFVEEPSEYASDHETTRGRSQSSPTPNRTAVPRSNSITMPSLDTERSTSNDRGRSTPQRVDTNAGSDYSTRDRSPSLGANLRRVLTFNNRDAPRVPRQLVGIETTIYSSLRPFDRPPYVDNMIRERINMKGDVRSLEPVEELEMMQIDPEELGVIKSGPVSRYLAGKALWDKRFAKTYHKVQKRREHHLQKSLAEQDRRIRERSRTHQSHSLSTRGLKNGIGMEDESSSVFHTPSRLADEVERSVYDLHLHGERPPPSSIAARKDTSEARKLAAVLDEHYSKLKSLRLWQATNDIVMIKSNTSRAASHQEETSEE